MSSRVFSLAAALVVAAGASTSGCGGQARSAAPAAGTAARLLAHSPRPLAALHAQADELLGGGSRAFTVRLRALRGYPVVINKWASWCGPCEIEFPAFQQASVRLGREVAFVGIDGKDAIPAARAFLRRFPVSYPSYFDPSETIARQIGAATYYPQTIYVDRAGRAVYEHAGPYSSTAALERDIDAYVLGRRGGRS